MSEEIKVMKIDYALLQNKFIECNSEKMVLQLENSQLKERIEKAIEYIEKHCSGIFVESGDIVYVTPSANILEILKGDKDDR